MAKRMVLRVSWGGNRSNSLKYRDILVGLPKLPKKHLKNEKILQTLKNGYITLYFLCKVFFPADFYSRGFLSFCVKILEHEKYITTFTKY